MWARMRVRLSGRVHVRAGVRAGVRACAYYTCMIDHILLYIILYNHHDNKVASFISPQHSTHLAYVTRTNFLLTFD